MIVAVASFVICGLFLLMAIPLEISAGEAAHGATADRTGVNDTGEPEPGLPAMPPAAPAGGTALSRVSEQRSGAPSGESLARNRIPYERDKTVRFFSADQIAAIRAEGHYSRVINGNGEFFCPWPISRVAEAVGVDDFIRTHRSYLVNLAHVSGFRREGDKAVCFVNNKEDLRIPVSRSRISDVQDALGLN
jgi:DNA-binding LytR/AlgR family response regulator